MDDCRVELREQTGGQLSVCFSRVDVDVDT